jgi:hypothetical protein
MCVAIKDITFLYSTVISPEILRWAYAFSGSFCSSRPAANLSALYSPGFGSTSSSQYADPSPERDFLAALAGGKPSR